MKIGILGAGGIARSMALTVNGMPLVTRKVIAARDAGRAEAFRKEFGFDAAYGSYAEMLADPDIDLVYIAVPHSHHFTWTMAALQAGKNVLCEKAFSVNAGQAETMTDFAKSRGLLLTEAIWTRYMPYREIVNGLLASGEIGEVHTLTANLGYPIDMNERIIRPELAGGALLDLSVYPLNFASMFFGDDIARISASCVKTDTGVDGQDSIFIEYKDGRMASLFTTIYAATDQTGYIYGRDGYIEVSHINNPDVVRLWKRTSGGLVLQQEIRVPEQITGYEYEVAACDRAIRAGALECPEMPHQETIRIMRQMDEIRSQFGIVFPGIE